MAVCPFRWTIFLTALSKFVHSSIPFVILFQPGLPLFSATPLERCVTIYYSPVNPITTVMCCRSFLSSSSDDKFQPVLCMSAQSSGSSLLTITYLLLVLVLLIFLLWFPYWAFNPFGFGKLNETTHQCSAGGEYMTETFSIVVTFRWFAGLRRIETGILSHRSVRKIFWLPLLIVRDLVN